MASEHLTLSQIFAYHVFVSSGCTPGYVWTWKQRKQVLDELWTLWKDRRLNSKLRYAQHSMGSLEVRRCAPLLQSGSSCYEVMDGLRILVTLEILLAVLAEKMEREGLGEEAARIREKYLKTENGTLRLQLDGLEGVDLNALLKDKKSMVFGRMEMTQGAWERFSFLAEGQEECDHGTHELGNVQNAWNQFSIFFEVIFSRMEREARILLLREWVQMIGEGLNFRWIEVERGYEPTQPLLV